MLPLSYQGFGFTAILLMVLILSMVEAIKWLRGRSRRSGDDPGTPELLRVDPETVRVGTPLQDERSKHSA